MLSHNPYETVIMLEEMIAEYSGSKYAVSVESCTMALFLSLMYVGVKGRTVTIPNKTYVGVPCSIINAGGKVRFDHNEWEGKYKLNPFDITDGALRFKRGMYEGGLHCLSCHVKKILCIGRGGFILTDDTKARDWLRKARFDGRQPIPMKDDNFEMIGWNCYMTPEQAARGIQLFQVLKDKDIPDLKVEEQGYPDLSKFPIYQQ
jgi:dTDP-4-amino-4,6-dideoxygalactose transaminase